MAKVVLRDSNGVKEFVILGEVTIGRLPENTVAVFDPLISRKHAKISVQDGQYILEDMASAGGTRVNNQPITRHVLQDTDQIEIGNAHLVFLGDKPQNAGDGLFEKTMVGNDPLFAPTMIGGAPPPRAAEPPPPPAPVATPPVASPPTPPLSTAAQAAAARPTIPIRPRIILPGKRGLNKRKLIQVAAAFVIFGLGGLWAYQALTETTVVEVDWTALEALYKENRLPDLQARLDALAVQTLSEKDRKTLDQWKSRIGGSKEAREVEALIFEKGDFAEASSRALADGNRYADMSKQFGDLARISMAATFILDSLKETDQADEAKSLEELQHLINHCREAEERFTTNKADMERLPVIVSARQTCANRLTSLESRRRQILDAQKAWDDVKTARGAKDWAGEVSALKRLSLLPAEVTAPLTAPAQVEPLLKNASVFLQGITAYRKADYDTATQSLSAVEPDDLHAAMAQEAIAEMRAAADYNAGVKLYREGKGEQALTALTGAKSQKAIELRERVRATLEGFQKVVDLRNRKVLDELIPEATRVLATLTAPEDEFYREAIQTIRTDAQRQRVEAYCAAVEDLARRNRLGESYVKSVEVLKDPDVALFPELESRITTVRDTSLKTIQQDVGGWVQSANQFWNQYKQNPITSEERTVTTGIPESFRKKSVLLNQAFEKIAQVQGVIQALPEEKAKPVLEVYEQIRQEILRQAEKVFAIRTQYSQLGNFDQTRQADEMIVLLGDVPGNQYYRLVVKKE